MVPVFFGLSLSVAQAVENPFRVEVTDAEIAAGATGKVTVTVIVPEGFHVYRDMMDVQTVAAGALTVGAPSYPKGLMKPDPASPGQDRELYEDDVLVEVPITVPAGASGEQQVTLKVRYQGCKKTLCYMPAEDELVSNIRIAGVAPDGAAPAAPAAPTGAVSPPPGQETPVIFTPGTPTPGQLIVHADLQGDWHLNKMFMSLALVDAAAYTLGEPVYPAGVKSGSEADGTAREDFEKDFNFGAPLTGPEGKVKVEIGYQACKGIELCLPPTATTITVPVSGGTATSMSAASLNAAPPSNAKSADTKSAAVAGTDSAFADAAAKGILPLLLLCFVAGVGVSFTPCVLPIVPITMGIIGARSAGNRFKALSLAATYVLSQALVYTSLGMFAAVMGRLFGSWLQSVWVTGSISILFVVMGFSMFGFFDVAVPSFISNRLSGAGPKSGGYVGAAALGVIGALVAGPCSGPIIASILAFVGTTGQVGLGAGLMFTFSIGMGLIFLVTGATLGWLPARGVWMVAVKKGMGIGLWLAAVYFSAPHLPTEVTALLTAAVLLITGVFAWPSEEDGEEVFMQRARQLYGVVGVIVGAYLLVGTMVMKGFILPPVQLGATASAATSGPTAGIVWLSDHDTALAQAQQSGKPIMIDFTAEWCAACHEMEKYTYTDPTVMAEAEKFVTVMIDCTKESDPAVQAIQKRYGVTGLPTVVFVSPDGQMLGQTIGFVEAPEFLQSMKKVQEKG